MSAGNWKDMFQAAQTGDKKLVEYYLRIGTDPNHQHPEFLASVLVESIRYNHLEIARLLLENGADPHIKEIWGGASPLSVAQENKSGAAVQLLEEFF